MKRFLMMLVALVTLTPALFCQAGEKDQAVALVQKAAAYYRANGMEKALEEFSNPKGQFREGELYVFAYDLSGTMLAHPNNTLIGQNLVEVPDSDGKMFRREIVDKAGTVGSGWVDYKYQNPKSKTIEPKSTYFEKADELVICCGIYKR